MLNLIFLSLLITHTHASEKPNGTFSTTLGNQHTNPIILDYSLINNSLPDVQSLFGGGTTGQMKEATEFRNQQIEQHISETKAKTRELELKNQHSRNQVNQAVNFSSVDNLVQNTTTKKPSVIHLEDIINPSEESLPYRFESQPGNFRDEITQQYKDLYKITAQGYKKETAREIGLFSTEAADHSYSVGELEDAEFYRKVGKEMLDLVVGLDPVTGFGRSAFELLTGRNLVTGANLTTMERGFAFLGVMTVGTSNSVRTATRMFHIFEGASVILKERQAFAAAIHEGKSLAEKVSHLLPGFTKHAQIKAIHTAEHVNGTYFPQFINTPPFQLGSHVIESVTLKATKWARVHGLDNQARPWIMRKSAIQGFTAEEIKKNFALPTLPTHVSDVTLPKGTKFFRGNIQDHGLGGEGAIQYWIQPSIGNRVPKEWFSNMRKL